MIYFVGGIMTMITAVLFLPESPKFLYTKQKFTEAREVLLYISRFNGIRNKKPFLFDDELENGAIPETVIALPASDTCQKIPEEENKPLLDIESAEQPQQND